VKDKRANSAQKKNQNHLRIPRKRNTDDERISPHPAGGERERARKPTGRGISGLGALNRSRRGENASQTNKKGKRLRPCEQKGKRISLEITRCRNREREGKYNKTVGRTIRPERKGDLYGIYRSNETLLP